MVVFAKTTNFSVETTNFFQKRPTLRNREVMRQHQGKRRNSTHSSLMEVQLWGYSIPNWSFLQEENNSKFEEKCFRTIISLILLIPMDTEWDQKDWNSALYILIYKVIWWNKKEKISSTWPCFKVVEEFSLLKYLLSLCWMLAILVISEVWAV